MVTIREIADAVGVSPATVSRVLNFDSTLSISPKKRQAIIETAEALHYLTPRNRKKAAPNGVHKLAMVHFLRPEQELVDPYYVGMRLGIESRCHARKIETVTVYHTERAPDANLLLGASAVIAIGRHDNEEIAWLEQNSKHLVFADFAPAADRFDSVMSDLGQATRRLLQALTDMGFQRIGFIGWDDIPGDIAVASFNDISVAQFLHPPLSTVKVPFEEIGEAAVDLVLERASGRTLAKKVTLSATPIWRGSTPPFAGDD